MIYRTLVEVEIFGEQPFVSVDLDDINHAITDGDCIGNVQITSSEPVPAEDLRGHLLRIGNDGTFFEPA